jgi:putative PIN family toxin of toxin-antitoxin system
MRVVLDTNVLIAAFIARGVCSDLLEHCVQHHRLVTSEFILGEFRKTMTRKFKFKPQDVNEAEALLRSRIEVVAPQKLKTSASRDSDDDIVIGTAIAANADCIVTGDKDLLVLGSYQSTPIIPPSEFVNFEAVWKK